MYQTLRNHHNGEVAIVHQSKGRLLHIMQVEVSVYKPRSQRNVKRNRTRIVKQAKRDRMNKML
jgi:hypothetical protein